MALQVQSTAVLPWMASVSACAIMFFVRYATIFMQLGHHIAEQRLAPLYDKSMWYIFDAHMCICLHIIKNHIYRSDHTAGVSR